MQRLQDDEDSSDLGEEAIDETCVDTNVIHMEDIAAEILVFKSNKQGNIEAANVEHCYTTTPNEEDYRNTDVPGKRKVSWFPPMKIVQLEHQFRFVLEVCKEITHALIRNQILDAKKRFEIFLAHLIFSIWHTSNRVDAQERIADGYFRPGV